MRVVAGVGCRIGAVALPRHSGAPPPLTHARLGRFDLVLDAVQELSAWVTQVQELYPLAISCLGTAGELLRADSATGNAFVRHYTASDIIPQMEAAVGRLRRSDLIISVDAIHRRPPEVLQARRVRAASCSAAGAQAIFSGTSTSSFLMSNFKMKSLQRAFLEMDAAEFRPDLATRYVAVPLPPWVGLLFSLIAAASPATNYGAASVGGLMVLSNCSFDFCDGGG